MSENLAQCSCKTCLHRHRLKAATKHADLRISRMIRTVQIETPIRRFHRHLWLESILYDVDLLRDYVEGMKIN